MLVAKNVRAERYLVGRAVVALAVAVRAEVVAAVVANFDMKFSLANFCVFCACAFAFGVVGCASSSEKHLPSRELDSARAPISGGNSYTLSEKKLLDILKQQDALFADPNINSMGTFSQAELKTKALRIESQWKAYFMDNPEDVKALVLYGKFLRRIGQDSKAYATFKQADNLDGRIAVVKQQLSALEAEVGSVKEAYGHICQALALGGDERVFLTQKAYIMVVGKRTLVSSGVLSPKEFDKQLAHCYSAIAEKNPDKLDVQLRYAQSFYDLFEPDWNKALSIWQEVLRLSALNIERQIAQANIARVLIELNRDAEARQILENVTAPSLERAKKLLIKELDKTSNSGLKNQNKSAKK